jgi:hypothetical protein
VKGDLEFVQRAVRRYDHKNNLGFHPKIDIPSSHPSRQYYTLLQENARILWACRGRVWNRETNDWVKKQLPDGRWVNDIDVVTLEHSAGIGRIVITETYSGWRDENMRRATWKHHPRNGTLDPDEGKVHRTGYGQPATKKTKFPTTKMLTRLRQHVARWKKRDAREGHDYIFRKKDDDGPYSKITSQYAQIVEAAGLDAKVVLHTHRHTLATWSARMGIPIEATAKLMGVVPKTISAVYRHVTPQTDDDAIEMWNDPKRRARLRTLTREPDRDDGPAMTAEHGAKLAPPRKVKVLKRVAAARRRDGGRGK